MKPLRSILCLGLALVAGPFAFATTMETKAAPSVGSENGAKPRLDFELSDGRHFVRLADLPPRTTLVNFWRHDCPACLREMPLLATLARDGKLRVVAVALHRPNETLLAPPAVQDALAAPLLALFGPGEPRGLLSRFGNRPGALPHTVVLDSRRRPCAQLTGEISQAWAESALARCSN